MSTHDATESCGVRRSQEGAHRAQGIHNGQVDLSTLPVPNAQCQGRTEAKLGRKSCWSWKGLMSGPEGTFQNISIPETK